MGFKMFDRADVPDIVLKIEECTRNMRPLNSVMVTGADLMKYISMLNKPKHSQMDNEQHLYLLNSTAKTETSEKCTFKMRCVISEMLF